MNIPILSGLGSFWMPPLRAGNIQMDKALDQMGFPADETVWFFWRWRASKLARQHKPGEPVVFIGHSQGGFGIAEMAKYFAKKNIPVDLLILLDTTLSPKTIVGHNVKEVLEIRATSGVVEMGRDEKNGKGVPTFLPGWKGKHTVKVVDVGHTGLPSDPECQLLVYKAVKRVMGK